MKFKTIFITILLTLGAVGIAQADPVNMVTNGNFNMTSPTPSGPWQFGSNSGAGYLGPGNTSNCTYGGQFVTGWSGNGGYGLWYSSAAAATGTDACTQYPVSGNTQRLSPGVDAPPVGSGSFIGLDGQPGLHFSVSQDITGLDPGSMYNVSFYWGQTQEMSREGPTTELLQVSLGGQSFMTPQSAIDTHGWTGWMAQSFTFLASTANETLTFLSIGTPANLPPFAVLTGVTMHKVPEPPVLAMFGGGLLGLGLLTLVAHRRSLRLHDGMDDGDLPS